MSDAEGADNDTTLHVEYFRKTDLAVAVNEALAHVLEVRPENPRELLAAFLLRPRTRPTSCELHVAPVSANSMATVLGATAMGITFSMKTVDMMAGEHKTPAFLAINPAGQVPALRVTDPDVRIGESGAILRTLANLYPVADHWYPISAARRADVDRWLDWRQTAWYPDLSPWIYTALGFFVAPDAAARRDKSVATFNWLLERIGDRYVAGDEVSIADLSIVSLLHGTRADPTFTAPAAWTAYWNRVKRAVGEEAYDRVFQALDGYAAAQRTKNGADPNFLKASEAPADAPAAAPAESGTPAEE